MRRADGRSIDGRDSRAEVVDVEGSDADRPDGRWGSLVVSTLLFPLHATEATVRFGLRSIGLLPRSGRN